MMLQRHFLVSKEKECVCVCQNEAALWLGTCFKGKALRDSIDFEYQQLLCIRLIFPLWVWGL